MENFFGTPAQQKKLLNTLLVELIDCTDTNVYNAVSIIAIMHLDKNIRQLFINNHNVVRLRELRDNNVQND